MALLQKSTAPTSPRRPGAVPFHDAAPWHVPLKNPDQGNFYQKKKIFS